jgi:hypothetical protein
MTTRLLARTIFAMLAVAVSATEMPAAERSVTSVQIQEYLSQMKALTAVPWSIDVNYELVGRSEDKRMEWLELSRTMTWAVLVARPTDIDSVVVDDLVSQAVDPWGWESTQIHAALGHIGRRAVLRLVEVIETAPIAGNRAEYFSRGLQEVLANTSPQEIDTFLVDRIAGGLDSPDPGTAGNVAQALGAIGPAARRAIPALERSFERACERDRELRVNLGVAWSDLVRWQIEKITEMTYQRDC